MDRPGCDTAAAEQRGELLQVTGVHAGGVRAQGAQPAGHPQRSMLRPDVSGGLDLGGVGHAGQPCCLGTATTSGDQLSLLILRLDWTGHYSAGDGSVGADQHPVVAVSLLLLRLPSSICCGLLVAAGVLIALQMPLAGTVVVGLFGAVVVVLGAVLVFDLRSAAAVMARVSLANRGGGATGSARSWSARKYRALGVYFVIYGSVVAGFAWSGSLHCNR